MIETPRTTVTPPPESPVPTPKTADVFIHRVCIQCNGVFRVLADKFDAKQCPNCHKG